MGVSRREAVGSFERPLEAQRLDDLALDQLHVAGAKDGLKSVLPPVASVSPAPFRGRNV